MKEVFAMLGKDEVRVFLAAKLVVTRKVFMCILAHHFKHFRVHP
jgi:hypothetical protein